MKEQQNEFIASEPEDNVTTTNNPTEPGEKLFSLWILLIGIVGFLCTFQMTDNTLSDPASLPRLVSVILILCGILVSYKNFKRARWHMSFSEAMREILPKDVCVMAAFLAIYCVALPNLHFVAASYLFMLAGMVYLRGKAKIISSLVISALATAALVAIFQYIFMVILP